MHVKLLGLATRNGYEFGAHKYLLVHFRRHHNTPVCEKLPKAIPHLCDGRDSDNPVLRTQLKPTNILGILVDPLLRWEQHVAEIEVKVARKLRALMRINESTWGRSLHEMRELYRTAIIPMIAYGCWAWYINVHNAKGKWHIIQKLVERLDRWQYSCLMQISGAFYTRFSYLLSKVLMHA